MVFCVIYYKPSIAAIIIITAKIAGPMNSTTSADTLYPFLRNATQKATPRIVNAGRK